MERSTFMVDRRGLYNGAVVRELGQFCPTRTSGLIDEHTYLQTDWYSVNLCWLFAIEGHILRACGIGNPCVKLGRPTFRCAARTVAGRTMEYIAFVRCRIRQRLC